MPQRYCIIAILYTTDPGFHTNKYQQIAKLEGHHTHLFSALLLNEREIVSIFGNLLKALPIQRNVGPREH